MSVTTESWTSVDQERCNVCGVCVLRCPMNYSKEDGRIDAHAGVETRRLLAVEPQAHRVERSGVAAPGDAVQVDDRLLGERHHVAKVGARCPQPGARPLVREKLRADRVAPRLRWREQRWPERPSTGFAIERTAPGASWHGAGWALRSACCSRC